MVRTFEQLSHVKIVPRFFPFLVTPGSEPETLNPSSTGTELLTPCLATGVLCTGMVTGRAGAWVEEADRAGPGGDADEDIDSEARELRVVVAVCKPTALDSDACVGME